MINTDIRTTYHYMHSKNRDNGKLSTIAKDHCCTINHQGSAGKMEADGSVACFKRSKAKYDVQYTKYLGDGDCKAALSTACKMMTSQKSMKSELDMCRNA